MKIHESDYEDPCSTLMLRPLTSVHLYSVEPVISKSKIKLQLQILLSEILQLIQIVPYHNRAIDLTAISNFCLVNFLTKGKVARKLFLNHRLNCEN